MITAEKPGQLAMVLLLVLAGIAFLTMQSPPTAGGGGEDVALDNQSSETAQSRVQQKAARYERAKELQNPSGFINAEPFTMQELVGNNVVLLDMWTYSCINCQRTLPHLKQWWQDYRDDGLVIIGNHAPEFAFERERENVERAVERFNVTYPVVMDNEYGTWRAYDNRYWPQKYLIDVDGFIRYEHIGEGSYAETRQKIEELLREQKRVLGLNITIERGPGSGDVEAEQPNAFLIGTPELYFGAFRNDRLANGESNTQGVQTLSLPENIRNDQLYLSGTWAFTREYASSENGSIILKYQAKDVNMVLDSSTNATLRIERDGEPLAPEARGEDVSEDSTVLVDEERLYSIVDGTGYGRHTLNITVEEGRVDAYTFTFG